jgi:hypothetical protein
MSKQKASTIFTHSAYTEDKSATAWDRAITDAERMIAERKSQITALKRSIESFRHLRDSGAPFPGEKQPQREQDAQ